MRRYPKIRDYVSIFFGNLGYALYFARKAIFQQQEKGINFEKYNFEEEQSQSEYN
jgi:hypothetical protein